MSYRSRNLERVKSFIDYVQMRCPYLNLGCQLSSLEKQIASIEQGTSKESEQDIYGKAVGKFLEVVLSYAEKLKETCCLKKNTLSFDVLHSGLEVLPEHLLRVRYVNRFNIHTTKYIFFILSMIEDLKNSIELAASLTCLDTLEKEINEKAPGTEIFREKCGQFRIESKACLLSLEKIIWNSDFLPIFKEAKSSLIDAIRGNENYTSAILPTIKNWYFKFKRYKALSKYYMQLEDKRCAVEKIRNYTEEDFQRYRKHIEERKEDYSRSLKGAICKLKAFPNVKKLSRHELESVPFSILKGDRPDDLYCLTPICLAFPTRRSIVKIGLKIAVEYGGDGCVESITIHFDEPLAIKIVHLQGLEIAQQNQDVHKQMYTESFRLISTTSYKTHMIMPIFTGCTLKSFLSVENVWSRLTKWLEEENEYAATLEMLKAKVKLCLALAIKVKEYHDKHWVLMDLKPDNIIINMEGTWWDVNIIDADDLVPEDTPLLQTRTYGTESYIPPEIPNDMLDRWGEPNAGFYYDIFALGKIFTEIFIGLINEGGRYSHKLRYWLERNPSVLTRCNDSKDSLKNFIHLVYRMEIPHSYPILTEVDEVLTKLVKSLESLEVRTHHRRVSSPVYNLLNGVFNQNIITADNITIRY